MEDAFDWEWARSIWYEMAISRKEKTINAGALSIAYHEYGSVNGWPCILCHGFPYDVHAYTESAQMLGNAGARVIVPYLRGFGPTRFLSRHTLRSGEQAALGNDLLALMDSLKIKRAVLGGYDWGGRAACVVSALWPERVVALVSGGSYNIQNIAESLEPDIPEMEARLWYQYYFHSERGRRGLFKDRKAIAHQLWKMWSPDWNFDNVTFEKSAAALDNPDFIEIVIHSYRHRFGLVPGDPSVAHVETRLAAQPCIAPASITIDGNASGLGADSKAQANKFIGPHEHRYFNQAGHNLPQEQPREWVQAIMDARAMSSTEVVL